MYYVARKKEEKPDAPINLDVAYDIYIYIYIYIMCILCQSGNGNKHH